MTAFRSAPKCSSTSAVSPARSGFRIIEIGDAGEVVLELWCKGGKGQFSVAGNTVIFVAGAMENRNPARRTGRRPMIDSDRGD